MFNYKIGGKTMLFTVISIVVFVAITIAVLNEAISFIREVMCEE